MTDSEAIAAVRRGERVKGKFSLHDAVKPDPCPGFNHKYRTLFCNHDEDVVECAHCGHQTVVACNFDDEYA